MPDWKKSVPICAHKCKQAALAPLAAISGHTEGPQPSSKITQEQCASSARAAAGQAVSTAGASAVFTRGAVLHWHTADLRYALIGVSSR